MVKYAVLFFAVLIAFSVCHPARVFADGGKLSFTPVDAEPLDHVSAGALVLHDNWQMRPEATVGSHGAEFSGAGFDAKSWYATSVPTTELGTLVEHGVYPDPYVGMNMMHIPDVDEAENARYDLLKYSAMPNHANPWTDPYWFRTSFDVPRSYMGKTVWLHLDGINYRADVWVNGVQVGNANDVVGMFRRFEFDVSKCIKPGQKNALAVCIHPLDSPGDPVIEQLGGFMGNIGPNGGDGQIETNVTQCCTAGWDWCPSVRDRNVGIWQHVWLEATGPVTVRDPAAFTAVRLPQADQASVTIRGYLDNAEATPVSTELTTTIAPIGFPGKPIVFHAQVMAKPGHNEFILKPADYPQLIMDHPHLWWPVTYGAQPLYRLTVSADVSGEKSGEATSLMGVRTVGTYILPSGGRAFTVNGHTIRLTGGAWVPDLMLTWSAQRYRDEVDMYANSNETVMLVNGCGIMPPNCLFDECDRRGVLVWEDFSRTSVSNNWPVADPQILMDNMKDCIARMRGHASLLVWCGANESVPQENFDEPMQDEVLPAMDGTRPWLVTSSSDAPWEKERNDVWSHGPYGLEPLPYYFNVYAKGGQFATKDEIGLGSPPPINTIARFLPDYNIPDPASYPLNQDTGFHDTMGHYRPTDAAIHQLDGKTTGMDDYLWNADLFNEMAYRAIYEAANKARPINSGTLIWKINAACVSYQWQLYDWTMRPNAGYYSLKEACKSLHVQESEDDQGLQVVSTLGYDRPNLKVRIGLYDANGKPQYSGIRSVDAAEDKTVRIGVLPAIADDGRLHFLSLDLLDAKGDVLDHNVKWIQRDCNWNDLETIAPTKVVAQITGQRRQGYETIYNITATNTGDTPAIDAWVQILKGRGGEEVLPSFWNDNALTLLPGEKRTLTVHFRTALLKGASPYVMVEGYNVTPRETGVSSGQPVPMTLHIDKPQIDPIHNQLDVSVSAEGMSGPRITTWPVAVLLDNQPMRTVRIGLQLGQTASFTVTTDNVKPGKHTVTVGSYSTQITIPYTLWTIGGPTDFKLAPADWKHYDTDGKYIIGKSTPSQDWPFIQPGPDDIWAGSKKHTFTIDFKIGTLVPGASRLVLDLASVQPTRPPVLNITVNDAQSELNAPLGSDPKIQDAYGLHDALLLNDPLPIGTLKPGWNHISITTESGSWIVYNDVKLYTPAGTTLLTTP